MTGPILLNEAEHRCEIRMPEFGKLAIRVLESDGSPAVNAQVTLRPIDGVPSNAFRNPSRTDQLGTFVFEQIEPCRHEVRAWRDQAHPSKREIEVRSGQITELELQLPR